MKITDVKSRKGSKGGKANNSLPGGHRGSQALSPGADPHVLWREKIVRDFRAFKVITGVINFYLYKAQE